MVGWGLAGTSTDGSWSNSVYFGWIHTPQIQHADGQQVTTNLPALVGQSGLRVSLRLSHHRFQWQFEQTERYAQLVQLPLSEGPGNSDTCIPVTLPCSMEWCLQLMGWVLTDLRFDRASVPSGNLPHCCLQLRWDHASCDTCSGFWHVT